MSYMTGIGVLITGLTTLLTVCLVRDVFRRSAHAQFIRQQDAELFALRIKAARKRVSVNQEKTLQWAGTRKFVVKRRVIEDANGEVCSFYLSPHDGKAIPSFKPGQFLTFHLHIPGQSGPVVRCYSLSDAANPDYYRVSIKRVPAPRNLPDAPHGLVSNYFHDHVHEGDILDVSTPAGNFFLDMVDERPVVLIGGGVGLTPVLSMINTIVETGSSRETWFFYGVRNHAEHLMKEHLEQLAREHDNIHLHICYSQPSEDDVLGKDYAHAERVSVALFKKLLPSNNYDFYMCGPSPMMDSIVTDLKEWEVPKSSIHLETFGPSAQTKVVKKANPNAAGPKVTFNRGGKTSNWDENSESLWKFAESLGVSIPLGCAIGSCGTCMTAVISGEVAYDSPPDFECEAGSCLPCCCKPKGEISLDA
jgi:ferredoxin-NADP reductase